jgi:hypothetical protein
VIGIAVGGNEANGSAAIGDGQFEHPSACDNLISLILRCDELLSPGDHLRTQPLPGTFDIKKKVDAGGTLDQFDIAFFNKNFEDTSFRRAAVDTHPKIQEIVARITHLYREITERALANEQAKAGPQESLENPALLGGGEQQPSS